MKDYIELARGIMVDKNNILKFLPHKNKNKTILKMKDESELILNVSIDIISNKILEHYPKVGKDNVIVEVYLTKEQADDFLSMIEGDGIYFEDFKYVERKLGFNKHIKKDAEDIDNRLCFGNFVEGTIFILIDKIEYNVLNIFEARPMKVSGVREDIKITLKEDC